MNWKEHPHLFANGKFKVRVKLNDQRVVDTEYSGVNEASVKKFEIRNVQQTIYPYKILKLIARPRSDMTDGERANYNDLKVNIDSEYQNPNGEFVDTPESFLYLLSIGVYPFDDETDVIFKPNI